MSSHERSKQEFNPTAQRHCACRKQVTATDERLCAMQPELRHLLFRMLSTAPSAECWQPSERSRIPPCKNGSCRAKVHRCFPCSSPGQAKLLPERQYVKLSETRHRVRFIGSTRWLTMQATFPQALIKSFQFYLSMT